MTYRVEVSAKARRLFAQANEWWSAHRPATSSLVVNETIRVVSFLADSPNIGSLYRRIDGANVRRIRLRKTPYYMYYLVDDDDRSVLVIAIWSAMRNEDPPI